MHVRVLFEQLISRLALCNYLILQTQSSYTARGNKERPRRLLTRTWSLVSYVRLELPKAAPSGNSRTENVAGVWHVLPKT